MDSALSLAPWELPPQTGAEAAGLADLRAMLAELSDASLERILFESAGDAATASKGLGAKPEEEPSSSPPSVVAEARRAGELDALLQKHLADVVNVEKLAWSGDGCGFRGGGKVSPSLVSVVASTAGGLEVAAAPAPSRPDPASPRSSIARWWASRKTVIGRKGRKLAKEAAAVAAAAAKETTTTSTTSSSAAAIIFAREAAIALSSSDAGVAGAAAWAVTRWLALHPAHWRALLDAGCVAPLVELLMSASSPLAAPALAAGSSPACGPSAAAASAAAAAAAAPTAAAAAAPNAAAAAAAAASRASAATTAAAAATTTPNDDAPAAACAALALRAIASSGPDAQAAAAAAGAVGAAVDALEAVEDDGLWTGLAAVDEEGEEEAVEGEGEGERETTAAAKNDDGGGGASTCASPRSPSSFPSPAQALSKMGSPAAPKNPLLAHRRAQQEEP